MSKFLDKGAFFDIAAQTFKTREVQVEAWPGKPLVRVRELSADEFKKISAVASAGSGDMTSRAMEYLYDVVIWCTIDAEGKQVFAPEDRAKLYEHAQTATFFAGLAEIANAAMNLSGLGSEEKAPN